MPAKNVHLSLDLPIKRAMRLRIPLVLLKNPVFCSALVGASQGCLCRTISVVTRNDEILNGAFITIVFCSSELTHPAF